MNKTLFIILLFAFHSANIFSTPGYIELNPRFEKVVLSKNIIAECDAEKGDERGPFGITFQEGKIMHTFLVMTGVYYDTCIGLERKIKQLKRKHSKLILVGTEDMKSKEPNETIWRWRAIRTISGSECISYFANDCE